MYKIQQHINQKTGTGAVQKQRLDTHTDDTGAMIKKKAPLVQCCLYVLPFCAVRGACHLVSKKSFITVPSPLPPSSSSFSSGRSPLTPNATAPHIKGVGSADFRLEAGSSHTRSRGPHPKGWQTAWDAASPAAVRIPGSKLEVFIEITHLTPARYSEAKSKVDGGKNIYFLGGGCFFNPR